METEFSDDLTVVRRHFPLESNFANTREAAQFAEAAAQQGQFLEYSDLLYDGQSDWSGESDPTSIFEGYADELGLNRTQLAIDLVDSAIDEGITSDQQDAIALGYSATPTFVLEGERQTGLSSGDPDELRTRIQAEIDAVDEVFRINRETGELTVADTDLFASANFPITVPVLVRDLEGNEEVVDVVVERESV